MKHIICFHLYNDYSGSPKVLKMILEGLLNNTEVDLITSKGGILDELKSEKLRRHSYTYHFSKNSIATLIRYSIVQVYTFLLSFKFLFKKDVIFYINTLLPVGPALAGRIMGKTIVYHYHENAFAKGLFYKVLAWCMQKLAHQIICVSEYQASFLRRKKNVHIIPNALPLSFTSQLTYNPDIAFERQTILMLASLKNYKGTFEFIQTAQSLPKYKFLLVLNETQNNIDLYIKSLSISIPSNLVIYPRQENVAPFYNLSSMAINLTNSKFAIETFGLTALEAMTAGLPVIVPSIGGIAELVKDGINGYKIDVQELDKIRNNLSLVLSDKDLYMKLSKNALSVAHKYDIHKMMDNISSLID